MAWDEEKSELHKSRKSGVIALDSVIIRLDRIIQSFFLDCPIKLGNDRIKDVKYLFNYQLPTHMRQMPLSVHESGRQ